MRRVAQHDWTSRAWPVVAALVVGALGAATVAVVLRDSGTLEAARAGVLGVLVSAAAYSDLRRGTIPNRLNGLGVLLGLAFALGGGTDALALAVQGGLVAGLALLGVRAFGHLVVGQPGMGYGDVKLGVVLGLFLGWGSLWALYLAAVPAALVGLIGITAGLIERRQRIPFAPCIAVGVLLHLAVLPPGRVFSWL